MNLPEVIRRAGVVGAGGAGFPAHIKASSRVEYVLANGAECEPLIHKDYELMLHQAGTIVEGLKLVMDATGAREGIIGVKEKNKGAVDAFKRVLHDGTVRLHLLGDFYPSGDEYILVYEATKRLIPPQGIPLNIGVVVQNVETLLNIARASEGLAVTEKYLTVAGAVRSPCSFVAPLGMRYRDALAVARGSKFDEVAVFVGGIMMGRLETNLDLPITKTTAGLVVLPMEHPLVRRKAQPETSMHRIGKSACDQCSYCTELCPRYILGYDVQPHKVMRSLAFTSTGDAVWNQYAQLCCSCGLCTLYACPESLFPKEACDKSKRDLKAQGIGWSGKTEVEPHPMYEGRRTPLKQLIKRLGIEEYETPSTFAGAAPVPREVELPLLQHAGEPSLPVVRVGESVKRGTCIAEPAEGALGARIHASIDGKVAAVNGSITIVSP